MPIEKESFGQRVKTKTKRIVRITVISLLLIGIGIFSFYYWGVYEDGVRAGTVIRISKMGVLFKTYEGQLNLGTFGSLKEVSPLAESFNFSVEGGREDVIKELEEVSRSGERVNLHYTRRYTIFPWRGATKYFVDAVQREKSDATPK